MWLYNTDYSVMDCAILMLAFPRSRCMCCRFSHGSNCIKLCNTYSQARSNTPPTQTGREWLTLLCNNGLFQPCQSIQSRDLVYKYIKLCCKWATRLFSFMTVVMACMKLTLLCCPKMEFLSEWQLK